MTIDSIRSNIFATRAFRSKSFVLFGETIEIRQPSVKQLLDLSKLDNEKDKLAVAQILINYAFVPGTDDKVFTVSDYDSIIGLPSGKWVSDLFVAWGELAGGDGALAEKN